MKLFMKYISLLLFFILLGFLYLDFLKNDYFKVKDVKVEGGIILLDGEIHNALLTLKGKNIWSLDTKNLENQLKKDVRIKNIKIERVLPSKLKISIEEEKPYIKVKKGEKILVANENGEIFSFSKELAYSNLIIVDGSQEAILKENLKVLKAIEDKELLSFISEIYSKNKEVRLMLNDGIYIKTDETVDKSRYETAKKVYKKLKNEGKEFSYIDIRFEDYIVK
ncbi:MAG: FtsQ-type POTRA domain-containing protein [Fusobacteriaceae bacterium]|nr:FtsQ-type POTRA domain-containing protein [Fusobacteriaceae bacterium]MBN2839240.1 FtsQ-type POTRA domain-containing protein [Fusobacteriaceae bacterium]